MELPRFSEDVYDFGGMTANHVDNLERILPSDPADPAHLLYQIFLECRRKVEMINPTIAHQFFGCAGWLLGCLYAAHGRRFPAVLKDDAEEWFQLKDISEQEESKYIKETHELLHGVDDQWMDAFCQVAFTHRYHRYACDLALLLARFVYECTVKEEKRRKAEEDLGKLSGPFRKFLSELDLSRV